MFDKIFLKNKNGQALVEAALIAPLMVFFLFTVIWFGRMMLTWQQISGAARYGTDMIAYTDFSKQYIETEIKNYLCNNFTIGRTLDREKLTVTVSIKDLKEPIDFTLDNFITMEIIKNPFKLIGELTSKVENVWEVLNPKKLITIEDNKSSVKITYEYKAPPIMRLLRQENIKLKAYSSVLADTGSPGSRLTENSRNARK
ncbi:MAG: pilus assembly protein [Endomicrobia bacterium]|nr:pilus assembly protein [Endomicrobiia bacterium]